MLIKRRWYVIPAGCHTKRKARNNVGLDLIDNCVRSGSFSV